MVQGQYGARCDELARDQGKTLILKADEIEFIIIRFSICKKYYRLGAATNICMNKKNKLAMY